MRLGYACRNLSAFRQHFANAPDLAIGAAQFLFNPLIPAIDVVDTIKDGLTFRDQGCDYQ